MDDDDITTLRATIAAGITPGPWKVHFEEAHSVAGPDLGRITRVLDALEASQAECARLRTALAAPVAPAVPAGMALVPVEPSIGMLQAALRMSRSQEPAPLRECRELHDAGIVWRAMVAAAPQPTPAAEDAAVPSAEPAIVTARELAQQVFALCESIEDQPDSPADSFALERWTAGQRFAAKQVRRGVGTWLTDEENLRRLAPQPAAVPLPLTDEQIDAAVKAWFSEQIESGRQPFGRRMRAAINAAREQGSGQ